MMIEIDEKIAEYRVISVLSRALNTAFLFCASLGET